MAEVAQEDGTAARGHGHRWLRGIIPPVCTPLDQRADVDTRSLERHVGFLLEAGVHGLFMLGSSSEVAFLTDAQRDQVLEIAVATASGQVPVLAGAIDMTTSRVVDQALRAKRLGADAIVVTAPFYAQASHPAETLLHFRTLRDRAGLPVVAYDIPVAVHSKLDLTVLVELAAEGAIEALKDSSSDLAGLRAAVTGISRVSRASVFTGSDLLVDCAMHFGASGAVPGLANVDPQGYVSLYERSEAGDWDGARNIQERLVRLFDVCKCADRAKKGFSSSVVGGLKTAMMLRGIIASNTPGLPQIVLDDDEVGQVRAVLEREGLL